MRGKDEDDGMKKDGAAKQNDGLAALTALFARYKYVLLVAAAGLLLLLWTPSGTGGTDTAEAKPGYTGGVEEFDLEALEKKIETLLGKAEGVGRVSVVLSLREGVTNIYADEKSESENQSMEGDSLRESDRSSESRPLVVSDSAGNEGAVVVRRIYPGFMGALIVCDGADSPGVRLKITQAVSSLTGIGADSITIVKMAK